MTESAKPENIAKANEILAELKRHRDGISRKKLAQAVHIKNSWLNFYLNGLLKDELIAYDERISGRMYWVGQ